MRLQARNRIPNVAAAYLEAYVALEISAHRAQALVERLRTITIMLTEAGTARTRKDAWKVAGIDELPTLVNTANESGKSIRLTKMPGAEQLLEAIADWRKKRSYLQQLWDSLPAEVRTMLKLPETLD